MNDTKKTYESMFVLPAGVGDFEAATEPVRRILARSEVEILAFKPWDERRLAYEIRGHRRGFYALVYFKVDPQRIREIEHDCQLDEQILRLLILRCDHLTQETLDQPTPATASERRAEERRREIEKRQTKEGPAKTQGEEQTDGKDQDKQADQSKAKQSEQDDPKAAGNEDAKDDTNDS